MSSHQLDPVTARRLAALEERIRELHRVIGVEDRAAQVEERRTVLARLRALETAAALEHPTPRPRGGGGMQDITTQGGG